MGLAHQKTDRTNPFFTYGHGKNLEKKSQNKDGTRTIMANDSGGHRKRLNVFSNPRLGPNQGTKEYEDSARVLR